MLRLNHQLGGSTLGGLRLHLHRQHFMMGFAPAVSGCNRLRVMLRKRLMSIVAFLDKNAVAPDASYRLANPEHLATLVNEHNDELTGSPRPRPLDLWVHHDEYSRTWNESSVRVARQRLLDFQEGLAVWTQFNRTPTHWRFTVMPAGADLEVEPYRCILTGRQVLDGNAAWTQQLLDSHQAEFEPRPPVADWFVDEDVYSWTWIHHTLARVRILLTDAGFVSRLPYNITPPLLDEALQAVHCDSSVGRGGDPPREAAAQTWLQTRSAFRAHLLNVAQEVYAAVLPQALLDIWIVSRLPLRYAYADDEVYFVPAGVGMANALVAHIVLPNLRGARILMFDVIVRAAFAIDLMVHLSYG
eukprot:3487613-Amphidinium_carterae.3